MIQSRAAFRAWAQARPRSRWERHDGVVKAMPRGTITLDPPGITVLLAGFHAGTDLALPV